MVTKTIEFSPFSRLEGDLQVKVDIVEGRIAHARASGTLYRGFEPMLRGREPLEALVDMSQIQQVLTNLIINAAEAITGEGEVTVSTALSADGDFVEVAIADTGCGSSQEDIQKLFEPFFTTKGSSGGTGLGLAVSYGIVSRHKGVIAVQSSEGHGSTFTVRLPRHKS